MLTFISPRKLNFHHNNFIISNKGWHVVIKLASSLPSNGSRLKFWAVLNSTLCKNPKTYAVTLFRYPAIRVCNQYGAAGKWRVLHRRFRTEQLLARLLKDLLKVTDLHESYLSVSTDIIRRWSSFTIPDGMMAFWMPLAEFTWQSMSRQLSKVPNLPNYDILDSYHCWGKCLSWPN